MHSHARMATVIIEPNFFWPMVFGCLEASHSPIRGEANQTLRLPRADLPLVMQGRNCGCEQNSEPP